MVLRKKIRQLGALDDDDGAVVSERPVLPDARQHGAAAVTIHASAVPLTAPGSNATRFPQYEEAGLDNFRTREVLGAEGDVYLHPMLRAILDVEAPVHFETIIERLRRRYRMARARQSTGKHVLRSIERFASKSELPLLRLDARYDLFLANPQQQAVPRSPGLSGPRQVLHIAPGELAEGLLLVLEEEGPLYRNDLIVRTARRFGFDRRGHTIREALDTAIQLLFREGRVAESYGSIRVVDADS